MPHCIQCRAEITEGVRFCGTCGADQTGGTGSRTGATAGDLHSRLTTLLEGRYRLEHLIGRGGMGIVFRAEDLTLERPVAIKVLPPEMSHDESFVERFQREARTAARLDHPGIIPIYAVESQEGIQYFVMKFITGKGLDQILDAGPVPVDFAQRILWQAATALGHAHQRGVIHRDIKPANIMLDEAGRVVLTDFGISKAMQAGSQLTATGQVIGTPHYMSPEQAKGTDVDGRSDQYALAMVGYRMLGGRLPFQDDSVHTIIYKQIFEEPERLDRVNPALPAFLVRTVHGALAKEPDGRFRTMEEFATAIWPEHPVAAPSTSVGKLTGTGSITDAPTEITPDTRPLPASPGRRGPPPRRKKPPMAGIAAGLFVLLAAGGGVGYWLIQDEPSVPTPVRGDTATSDRTPAGPVGGPLAQADTRRATPPDTTTTVRPEPEPPLRRPPARQPQRVVEAPRDTAQPRPTMGLLIIDAIPFGTVILDGVELGDTPIVNHEVALGRHVIRLVREGYEPIVDTVMVPAGQPLRRRYQLVQRR